MLLELVGQGFFYADAMSKEVSMAGDVVVSSQFYVRPCMLSLLQKLDSTWHWQKLANFNINLDG